MCRIGLDWIGLAVLILSSTVNFLLHHLSAALARGKTILVIEWQDELQ